MIQRRNKVFQVSATESSPSDLRISPSRNGLQGISVLTSLRISRHLRGTSPPIYPRNISTARCIHCVCAGGPKSMFSGLSYRRVIGRDTLRRSFRGRRLSCHENMLLAPSFHSRRPVMNMDRDAARLRPQAEVVYPPDPLRHAGLSTSTRMAAACHPNDVRAAARPH